MHADEICFISSSQLCRSILCRYLCILCKYFFGWLDWFRFFLVKTIWRIFCVISFNYFWKFSRLGNLAWNFWGVWFLPPFDHPRHLKSGVTPSSTTWVYFEVHVCTAIPSSRGKWFPQGFLHPKTLQAQVWEDILCFRTIFLIHFFTSEHNFEDDFSQLK